MDKLHKWEIAGLGQAPFKVVCIIELPSRGLLEQNPSAYNNLTSISIAQASKFNVSLGTCDVCSTALNIHFVIQDADNKHFVCGSECVKKSGDLGLINKSTALKNARLKEIKDEKEKVEQETRRAIYKAKIQAQKLELEALEKIEAPLRLQLEDSHKWLTDVLDKHDWNFCIEISNKLKNKFQPLSDYPDRAVSILNDIYSKSHGRCNSKKYSKAQEEFDNLLLVSSQKVESLKKELDRKIGEV